MMNRLKQFRLYLLVVIIAALLNACTGLPKDIEPVDSFELSKYLGTWVEMARLDHSFERGLSDISATYSLREDGGVRVLNKGYSDEKQDWKTAEGKAYFVEDSDAGHLKVSFFGPFYGSYVVFYLDDQYQHAFITSYNKDYLWYLSRSPEVSDDMKSKFIETARSKGFDVDSLIWVEHDRFEISK